jgi:hypothetical protein
MLVLVLSRVSCRLGVTALTWCWGLQPLLRKKMFLCRQPCRSKRLKQCQ